MLADELDYVVGVDTHRDRHALAVVDAGSGAVVAQTAVRADVRGYREALGFAGRHAAGARVWAVEGAGQYGAGLTRHLDRRRRSCVHWGELPPPASPVPPGVDWP